MDEGRRASDKGDRELWNEVSQKPDKADVADLCRIKANGIDLERACRTSQLMGLQVEFLNATATRALTMLSKTLVVSDANAATELAAVVADFESLRQWLQAGVVPGNLDSVVPGRRLPGEVEQNPKFKEEYQLMVRVETKLGLRPRRTSSRERE